MQKQKPNARRQRNRISFSCTNCRLGKYRCDRRMPCTTCVRRDKQGTCQYEEAAIESARQRSTSSEEVTPVPSNPKESPVVKPERPTPPPAPVPDLEKFGYSKTASYNTLGLLREISRIESDSGSSTHTPTGPISGNPNHTAKYLRLVRDLPPRHYVNILVEIFFNKVNWQYGFVDRSFFASQLADFYKSSRSILDLDQASLSSDVLLFPALLFQVAASALQFVPAKHDEALNDLCIGRSLMDLAKDYSDSGVEVMALFEKESLNVISIQAGLLRVSILKAFGYVVESWHTLGQVIMDAQEIGLDRNDDDAISLTSTGEMCSGLWTLEMKRRIVVNLMLWDSQLGIVLGKTWNIDPRTWSIVLPLDTEIPMDRSQKIPQERQPHEKPSQFTQRLIEVRLHRKLPEIRALLAEGGPYPEEFLANLRQEFYENLGKISPQFYFENPDRTWDEACPWLEPQRHYIHAATWLVLLVSHRPYIFTAPKCRTVVIESGIKVLQAQEREYRCLTPEFGKIFTLAFITLEAATAIMAVLIAFPTENAEQVADCLFHVRESITRLYKIGDANHFATPAADILQSLMERAEGIEALTNLSSPADESPQNTTMQNLAMQYPPEDFDFNDYSAGSNPGFPQSDTSNAPLEFDFNFGGVVDTFAPTSTMVNGDLTTSLDAWDPMILMGWSDLMENVGAGGNNYTQGLVA